MSSFLKGCLKRVLSLPNWLAEMNEERICVFTFGSLKFEVTSGTNSSYLTISWKYEDNPEGGSG